MRSSIISQLALSCLAVGCTAQDGLETAVEKGDDTADQTLQFVALRLNMVSCDGTGAPPFCGSAFSAKPLNGGEAVDIATPTFVDRFTADDAQHINFSSLTENVVILRGNAVPATEPNTLPGFRAASAWFLFNDPLEMSAVSGEYFLIEQNKDADGVLCDGSNCPKYRQTALNTQTSKSVKTLKFARGVSEEVRTMVDQLVFHSDQGALVTAKQNASGALVINEHLWFNTHSQER